MTKRVIAMTANIKGRMYLNLISNNEPIMCYTDSHIKLGDLMLLKSLMPKHTVDPMVKQCKL
jgi:hypothetical protein